MSDEHMDDILRELRDDLNTVQPSPEFAAKVRQQVAAQPERRWFGIWQVATAASIVAVAAVAVVLWRSPGSAPQPPAPIDVDAQHLKATPAETPSVQPVPPVGAPANLTAVRRTPTAAAVRTQPIAIREPEVLVPPDQRMALIALLDGMRMRGNQVPSETAALVDGEGRLPAPTEITVSPITIELLSPPMPGGGSSERR